MKPALSIVIFTVLSGGGLGLAAMLSVFANILSPAQLYAAIGLSFALTGGGLFASVFHLANPQNAWRAFMRVRSSWLSREAVCAFVFFPLLLSWLIIGDSIILRAAIFATAIATVLCTAMIYQSLKPIAAWHHPLTSLCYLAFSLQSGALLLATIAAWENAAHLPIVVCVSALTAAAIAAKFMYYRRLGGAEAVRIGRATGFSRAGAKLLDAGHTGPTFLTREFILQLSAKKLGALRIVSLALCTTAAPVGAVLAFYGQAALAVGAAALLFAGLLMERWLFFAEAKHVVRAYHGLEDS